MFYVLCAYTFVGTRMLAALLFSPVAVWVVGRFEFRFEPLGVAPPRFEYDRCPKAPEV